MPQQFADPPSFLSSGSLVSELKYTFQKEMFCKWKLSQVAMQITNS